MRSPANSPPRDTRCAWWRGGADVPGGVHDGVRVRRAAVDPIALDVTTESLRARTQEFEHGLRDSSADYADERVRITRAGTPTATP